MPVERPSWGSALRDIRRRDRAEFEHHQQAWFEKNLRRAEAELKAMGLPADCWRAVHLSFDPDADDEDPFQHVSVSIQSGPTLRTSPDGHREVGEWPGRELYEFVAAAPSSTKAWEAMRLASMARAVETAMHSDWPSARFALGRFFERTALAAPGVRQQIMRQALSRAGHKAVEQYMRGAQRLHQRIREEAERLRSRGHSIRGAARILAESAKLARMATEQGTKMLTASGIRALLSPTKHRKERLTGR